MCRAEWRRVEESRTEQKSSLNNKTNNIISTGLLFYNFDCNNIYVTGNMCAYHMFLKPI
jgi:hypothetical protein